MSIPHGLLLVFVFPILALLAGCNGQSEAANPAASRKAPTAAGAKSPVPIVASPGTFAPKVTHTDEEWKKILTPAQYAVLREKDTEHPFTGQYDDFFKAGTYSCAACGAELFTSDAKFNSGCGWPSFYAAKAGDRVRLVPDFSFGDTRMEVICANCGSHLGHVFDDAPETPTGNRYCINSASLKFTPAATQPGK